jgi:very-short-patch-repair endonuclease
MIDVFQQFCQSQGLSVPVTEYKFHPKRRWRIDYAWIDNKIAIEVEGGSWVRGRHTRGTGFIKDMEKYNNMTIYGWRLIRVTPQTLNTLETIEMIELLIMQDVKKHA